MARLELPRRSPVALAGCLLAARLAPAGAFIEEILGQAFGGGGGAQFQFVNGDDGDSPFHMMGGGGRRKPPKFPKGVPKSVAKEMGWMKGTEWNWNGWRNVKFEKDGKFDAPTRDCQGGMCKWSAGSNGKVYILWGEAGLHELDIIGKIPEQQDQSKMQGLRMKGRRTSDGERCQAAFQRVFDFEAAELEKDLYGALGLPDDADEADIKKVYRKLSIKYHPDKNPGEEAKKTFAAIRDAYEILSDPDKKILYDTGGMEAVKNHEKGQVEKGDNVGGDMAVTLEDFYTSAHQQATVDRRVVCRGCRAKPSSPKCRGCSQCPDETKTEHVQVGPGMFMQQQRRVSSKEKCKKEQTMLDVHIEKGMKNGETVEFPRMAEERPGQIPGSAIITLKVERHPKFERRGDDLHMNMKVTLRQALLGWTQTIRHLDGHTVEVTSQGITKPFMLIKVAGEGMPLRDDPASFGDLYIKVEVDFPKKLTEAQSSAVASAFREDPPRPEL